MHQEQSPATTGGVNLRPGQPSAVEPTEREKRLFEEGRQLDRKIEQGICQGCQKP